MAEDRKKAGAVSSGGRADHPDRRKDFIGAVYMEKLMGIDVGSTTVKVTVISPGTGEILF